MAGPFDQEFLSQLKEHAFQVNAPQVGMGAVNLGNPMGDLNSMVGRLGPGITPMGNSLPKTPLALNAGPQPVTPRFSAGASGIDDLLSQATKASGGVVDDVARLALPAGQTATAAKSLGGLAGGLNTAKGLFRNPLAGGGGIKALGKASLPGLGVSIAGNYLGNEIGGDTGNAISGAATGAGLGMMFGPWGALAGGIIGGGLSLFGGDDDGGDATEKLTKFISQAGLEDADQYLLQFEILKETTGDEKAALNAVGQQIVTDMAAKEQQQAQQQQMLATQMLTAQFFQPMTEQLLESATQRASVGEKLAADLPEGFRQIARSQNVAALDNATRTANAYAAQAQLLPTMAAMEQQQALAQQIAQQQAQAAMQGIGVGGSGGGGSLQSLIAQLAG